MPIEIATTEDVDELKRMLETALSSIDDLTRAFQAHTQSQMPEWLTVKEAADYLRLAPDTIRRKVRNGHFDTRRDGKNILISRQTVLDQSSS